MPSRSYKPTCVWNEAWDGFLKRTEVLPSHVESVWHPLPGRAPHDGKGGMVIRCRILVAKNLLDITTAPRLQMALAAPRPATRRATNRRATSTPPLPPAVEAGLEVCRRLKLDGRYGQGVGCADQRSHRGPVPALFCQAFVNIHVIVRY